MDELLGSPSKEKPTKPAEWAEMSKKMKRPAAAPVAHTSDPSLAAGPKKQRVAPPVAPIEPASAGGFPLGLIVKIREPSDETTFKKLVSSEYHRAESLAKRAGAVVEVQKQFARASYQAASSAWEIKFRNS